MKRKPSLRRFEVSLRESPLTEWEPFRLGDALSVSHGFAFKGEFFCDKGDLVVLTPGNFLEQGGFKPKSGKEKYYEGPFPDRFLLAKSQVVVGHD